MRNASKAYLIDRDGVLTEPNGGNALSGAVEWFNRLQSSGNRFLIASNHSTSSPEEAVQMLKKLGFSISRNDIHTPLTVLLSLFRNQDPERVFVIGTDKLKEFLMSHNVNVVADYNAETVLLGFNQDARMEDYKMAVHSVCKYGAQLIALHANRLYKTPDGYYEPGLGAWIRAVEYATGNKALIIGKPSERFFSTALDRLNAKPEEVLMISDDPLSDLGGAKQMGIKTVFVTSGKYEDCCVLQHLESDLHPDFILEDITQVPLP